MSLGCLGMWKNKCWVYRLKIGLGLLYIEWRVFSLKDEIVRRDGVGILVEEYL